eukprot:6187871-Pleurochrysis_carterae.AAC.3
MNSSLSRLACGEHLSRQRPVSASVIRPSSSSVRICEEAEQDEWLLSVKTASTLRAPTLRARTLHAKPNTFATPPSTCLQPRSCCVAVQT